MTYQDAARAILALDPSDPLREEKAIDIVKSTIHDEKHFVYLRCAHYVKPMPGQSASGETKDFLDFLRDKIATHERLADEWGVNYGYQYGNHLSFGEPVFHGLEDKALFWARRWHESQRYGRLPYHSHLKDVVGELKLVGITSPEILAAGFLHDVMEDCGKSKEDIAALFGWEVADIVDRLTRREGEAYYGKIKGSYGPTAVKLADRICNMRASFKDAEFGRTKMWDKYKAEYEAFHAGLYHPGLNAKHDELVALWSFLDAVARKELKRAEG